ncbi:MAG: Veg family protein [Bacillota bacterium]|nr:Veg family protein [Bacillota bacterium]
MPNKVMLANIKEDLAAHVGSKIRLKANRGRKKIVEREGILESTYPHVFVVKISEKKNYVQRVSYSYTDVLTESVELTLCKDEGEVRLACKTS